MQHPELTSLPNGVPSGMAYSGNPYNPTASGQTPWWLNGNLYVQPKGLYPLKRYEVPQAYACQEELPQAFNGMNVYNPAPNGISAVHGSDALVQAFNGLSMYNTPNANATKPSNPAVGSSMPFSTHGARANNTAYYNLNDGRMFYPQGQNGLQRGMAPFNVQQQPQYIQQPSHQNGNGTQAGVQSAIWNGTPQQQPVEVPDLAAPRRTSLSSNEENGPQTPFFGAHATSIYPKITVPDNSPQTWGTPSPQQLGQSQNIRSTPLWRDSEQKQYIIKDLDAICSEGPAIPRPIPAIFSDDKARGTLETSLENKTHTTNVYIRGLHPNTSDEMLLAYGARFGPIISAKSMIDQQNGFCKGFGFIKYHNYADGENCIRGFFHWGYEAKWARDSTNEKLKKLSDEENTNLYISNLPTEHDFNEHKLMAIFTDYECLSAKILRDLNGLSRGVGFARFSSPEICTAIIQHYNGHRVGEQGLPISIRFADTPDQKRLKALTQERRQYKTHEYNVAAYGPGSPYQHYAPVLSTMSSPLQPRSPLVNGQYAQLAYGYPYAAAAGMSPSSLPPSVPAAPPAVKISGAENKPLGVRSPVFAGLRPVPDTQTTAGNQAQKDVEVRTEGQASGQAHVKIEHSLKQEAQLPIGSEPANALGKRNPNIPSPSKAKKDYPVKSSGNMGSDVENISVAASSTSSPIKNTPSKAPKTTYART